MNKPSISDQRVMVEVQQGYYTQEEEINLRDIFSVISRRKKLIINTTAIMLLFTLIWILFTQPVYEATTKILVNTKGGGGGFSIPTEFSIPLFDQFIPGDRNIDTQIAIIKTKPIIQESIQTLGLIEKYGVKHKKLLTDTNELLKKVIFVNSGSSLQKKENIITISIRWEDPEVAKEWANTLAAIYMQKSIRMDQNVASTARSFVEDQILMAQKELRAKEEAVKRFKERYGIVDLSTQVQEKVKQYAELEAQSIKTNAELKNAQARLSELRSQINNQNPTFISATTVSNNPLIVDMQKQLTDLEVKKAGLRKEYGPKHPDVISADNQITELNDKMKKTMQEIVSTKVKSRNPVYEKLYTSYAELQADAFGLEATQGALSSVLEKNDLDLKNMPRKEQEFTVLVRDMETARKTYQLLVEKRETFKITEASQLGNLIVIEPAETPEKPLPRKRTSKMLTGFILGLFMGTMCAFIIEYLDNTIKIEKDIQTITGMPLLGNIPLIKTEEMEQILKGKGKDFIAADCFRNIRANIKFSDTDQPVQVLTVTSPEVGEGKSAVSANLALTCARAGKQALLIDGNFRNPAIHNIFNLPMKTGLTDILLGSAKPENAIQHTWEDNLDVIVSGSMLENPGDLAEYEKVSKMIEELKRDYNIIIIDTPPINAGKGIPSAIPETIVFSSVADGVICVAASENTKKDDLEQAMKILKARKSQLLGCVLNKIKYPKDKSHL